MSEFRFDPIKRHWVIVAEKRAQRPSDFSIRVETRQAEECPFCPGHEAMTPEALMTIPENSGDEWDMRLIPNKFPAVQLDAGLAEGTPKLHQREAATGRHEVLIETTAHGARQGGYDSSRITRILYIYQSRIREFMDSSGLASVAIFTNVGYRGGATLVHPHTQIVGMATVPQTLAAEVESGLEYRRETGRCLFCDLIASELSDGKRVVLEEDDFVVLAPYASRFAYEFAIYPRRHEADFSQSAETVLKSLSAVLKGSLAAMDACLHNPDYNLILHTAPAAFPGSERGEIAKAFHWHFEVIPRVSTQAGMEWGSGLHIISIPPEKAARVLSAALPQVPQFAI